MYCCRDLEARNSFPGDAGSEFPVIAEGSYSERVEDIFLVCRALKKKTEDLGHPQQISISGEKKGRVQKPIFFLITVTVKTAVTACDITVMSFMVHNIDFRKFFHYDQKML